MKSSEELSKKACPFAVISLQSIVSFLSSYPIVLLTMDPSMIQCPNDYMKFLNIIENETSNRSWVYTVELSESERS